MAGFSKTSVDGDICVNRRFVSSSTALESIQLPDRSVRKLCWLRVLDSSRQSLVAGRFAPIRCAHYKLSERSSNFPGIIFSGLSPQFCHKFVMNNIYKDFIKNNGLVLLMLPQCARAHDCIGYRWLSVNENLCLIDGDKVVGWSPLRWNRQS